MTKNSDFKKLVRERMAKTGESYATARRHLEKPEAPPPTLDGWVLTGPGDGAPDFELTDYVGGLEPELRHKGKAVAFLRSAVENPQSHAVIMQSISSAQYHDKRIRFSADIRCDAADARGQLWLRVVPVDRDSSYAWGYFSGTTDWTRGEIVVDVHALSVSIMFGVSLHGTGQVWMSDANFEVVEKSVPLTGGSVDDREPREPVNLSFDGGRR